MSNTGEKLLREALTLPAGERAKMAADLIASLDETKEEGVEKAWAEEIQRRAAAARAGQVKVEDWRTVLEQIEQDVLNG